MAVSRTIWSCHAVTRVTVTKDREAHVGGSAGRAEDGVPRVTQTEAGDLGSRIPVSLGTCRDGASFINPFFGLRPDVCKSKGLY